jgi:hypothetical protein
MVSKIARWGLGLALFSIHTRIFLGVSSGRSGKVGKFWGPAVADATAAAASAVTETPADVPAAAATVTADAETPADVPAAGDAALSEISASGYMGHVLVYVQLTFSPVLSWTVSVVPS